MSRGTEITFTPAEPIGISSASISFARACTNSGGRLRETAIRGRVAVLGGTTGGSPVSNVSPSAGSATAPATRSPSCQRATWTAQSSRGTSENSRVPSRGSTIQTRLVVSRPLSSLPSSESTASAGRCSASSSISSSWAARSPASLSSRPSSPSPRTSSSRSPATVASQEASTWSSVAASAGGVPGAKLMGFTLASRSGVELLLGPLETLGDEHLDGVGGGVDLERQDLLLGRGVVGEHEVGHVLPPGRAADADAHPVEVAGAQRGPHRAQPVVAVVAATELDPHRVEGDVELVVDRDDPLGRHLVETGELLDRTSELVHVAARLHQNDARGVGSGRAQPALNDIGAAGLVRPERRAHPGRELV